MPKTIYGFGRRIYEQKTNFCVFHYSYGAGGDIVAVGVSEDGVATWNAVEGASGYAYKIDDGAEIRTNETSVTLENGQSVRVKAVGDGKEYSDSAYSSVVKYIEGQASCSHVDSDDDGRCDNCDLVIAVYLDLFAVNDLHGKIFDTSDQPGVDELTTYLKGYAANGKALHRNRRLTIIRYFARASFSDVDGQKRKIGNCQIVRNLFFAPVELVIAQGHRNEIQFVRQRAQQLRRRGFRRAYAQ